MTSPAQGLVAALQALGLVTYVASARWAATEEQLTRLRAEVVPYLRTNQYRIRGYEQPVLDMVHAIMGEEWVPGAEWRKQLALLGRTETGAVRPR